MNDELILLWQQGTRAQPDATEVARLSGKAIVKGFDHVIARRNRREYGAGMIVLVAAVMMLIFTKERVLPLLTIAGGAFALLYLWRSHRNPDRLDPAADARSYQAAMLARIDKQVRLLSTVLYWYLLPTYVPGLWVVASTWLRSPGEGAVVWVMITATFTWVAWLNRRAVIRLKERREKIAALYK